MFLKRHSGFSFLVKWEENIFYLILFKFICQKLIIQTLL